VTSLECIAEHSPVWDEDKARIVGGAPAGIFDTHYATLALGEMVPGEWWRAEDRGSVVGYGWLDVSWGNADLLIATDVEARGRGVGTFILNELDREVSLRGLNYLCNVVRPTHPEREEVSRWFVKRGFAIVEDGRLARAVRRVSVPPPDRAAGAR
jgi:GNAT superfamily N-acetyltransferase